MVDRSEGMKRPCVELDTLKNMTNLKKILREEDYKCERKNFLLIKMTVSLNNFVAASKKQVVFKTR